MTNDKGIFIKNVYYMLSYAFRVLKQNDYERIAAEEFEQVQDLFAAILSKGVARQVKQGLCREYVPYQEDLAVLRGRISVNGTIRNRIQRKQRLSCEFDELSIDNLFNQILKTTIDYLMRAHEVSQKHKAALHRLLMYFDEVSMLEPSTIDWRRIQYHRSNRNYEMLLNICYFVLDGCLQTTENGEYRMASFSDEHMARLYERFILEYYRCHHTYLSDVRAAQIKWNLVGDYPQEELRFLPDMQSDVFLRLGEKVLIIDAKYYGKTMQQNYHKSSLHSANLYQIFTYVKNQDRDSTGNVSGILLYAKTQEEITPNQLFSMGGNQIGAFTLDLNRSFNEISQQLDEIAERFFGKHDFVRITSKM